MPVGRFPAELTYWAPNGTDEYGMATFVAPTIIHGRWEDRMEMVRLPSGDEIMSKAMVFVDQEVVADGWLGQGNLTDFATPGPTEALEIKQVSVVRNIRYSDQEIRAYL